MHCRTITASGVGPLRTAKRRSPRTLNPPLPCIDARLGTGFVHALAQDALLVQFSTPPSPSRCRGELTVTLGGGRAYSLPFTLPPQSHAPRGDAEATGNGSPMSLLQIEDPEAKARLADLLNLVRKGQHIAICETMDVEASDRYTAFADLSLVPRALPDLALSDLDTSTTFLGRRLPLPLLITGMTGGLARGAEINARLARTAARFGIPMGVGCQRVALENPEHAPIFAVKRMAPGGRLDR